MRGIVRGTIGRLRLLGFYFSKKEVRTRMTLREAAKAAFAPRCETVAPRFSTPINEDDQYIYYKICGEKDIFIYPKGLSYHAFAQVISEGCQKDHWHHYDVPPTRIAENDVVVDCGSAEGFFAFQYLSVTKHIYCIEPLPVFCRSLHKMFDDRANVTVIEAALSDRDGTLYINSRSIGIGSTCKMEKADSNDIVVQGATIDSLFADRGITVDFIKADIEGYEEKMIRGALKTIRMSRPKLSITTYHPGTNYRRIIEAVRQAVPEYRYFLKGVEELVGNPVMLHMWVE